MLKPIVTIVGTINVIQSRKDLILVTDPVEVVWILDYLGYPAAYDDDPLEFSGLLVFIRDGDFEDVFAFRDAFLTYIRTSGRLNCSNPIIS